jgi:salicylate hydroxylase
VPADAAPEFARRPVQSLWIGPGRHLVHYPISGGRLINIVAFVPEDDWQVESWSAQGSVEDLAAEFADWDPRLACLISSAPSAGRWALFDRDPLPAIVHGSVALLGDAAHPMFPFFAQGAAQAIEDAAALARCLADGGSDIPVALRSYEESRLERTTRIQLASRDRRDINHLPDGREQRARDELFAREDPLRHNGWLYGHDAEQRPSLAAAHSQPR